MRRMLALHAQVTATDLDRSVPRACSSAVASLSLDLLMGSAKTLLKVARLPSRSGLTKEIIAAASKSALHQAANACTGHVECIVVTTRQWVQCSHADKCCIYREGA